MSAIKVSIGIIIIVVAVATLMLQIMGCWLPLSSSFTSREGSDVWIIFAGGEVEISVGRDFELPHSIPRQKEWTFYGIRCGKGGYLSGDFVSAYLFIEIPLWATGLMASLSAVTAFVYLLRPTLRHYRRRHFGRCLHCGYNLTGNVSGRCPECGELV